MSSLAKCVLFLFLGVVIAGCDSGGTQVIEPTETYELTDQEQQNRDQEKKMMDERQQ